MEATKINRKKLILVCAAVLILILLVILRFIPREQGYRTISISELLGGVTAEDKGVLYNAYPNMHLYEGHALTTDKASFARMVLDGDKYVKLEEESRAAFSALGKTGSGKTVINLERGVLTNELTKPLKANESYVVNTPNAVLAVRGTFFRVEVIPQPNGDVLTEVFTYGGSVVCSRILPDGKLVDEQVIIDKGYKTTISMDKIETVYIVEEIIPEKENIEPIYMKDISDIDLAEMYESSSHGHELFTTTDEIWEHIEERGIDINEYHSQYDQTPLEPHKSQQQENTALNEGTSVAEPIEQEQQNNESDTAQEAESEEEDAEQPIDANTQIQQGNTAAELPITPAETPMVEQKPAENIPEELPEIEPPEEEPKEEEEPEEDDSDSDSDSDSDVTVGGGSGGGGGGAGQTHTHTEVTTTTPATCTVDGSEVVTCSSCGEELRSTVIPATGHDEEIGTISATCTVDGLETVSCSICGEELRSTVIPATGHTEGTPEIIDATCTTEGSRIVRCSSCNTVLENEVLPITHTGEICTCGAVKLIDSVFSDDAFRTYAASFDTNTNGYLDNTEIANVTTISLNNSFTGLSLDGIEHFTNLTSLSLYDVDVSYLDISANTALETVYISESLTDMTLGTGNFPNLTLTFDSTPIQYFDFLSDCSMKEVEFITQTVNSWNLQTIKADTVRFEDCSSIPSSIINLSGNCFVKNMWIDDMSFTELNLSNCTNLTKVVLGLSQSISVSVIDLRNCTGLTGSVDFGMINQYSSCTVYLYGSSIAEGNAQMTNTGYITPSYAEERL